MLQGALDRGACQILVARCPRRLDQAHQRALVIGRLGQDQLVGLGCLGRHTTRLIKPCLRGQHFLIARRSVPRALQQVVGLGVLACEPQPIGLRRRHDAVHPRDDTLAVGRIARQLRGALHGAGGKGIAPGLGQHAHDRFIAGRVGDGAGSQRLLRQLRRPFPVTQFEHRIGHRSLLGRVDAGGRGQLAQRHQRIGLPPLRGHRLGPLDRTVHLQADGEIAHLFRALHFGNPRHQRIGGRRPAAISVEQRRRIEPVRVARRSQRVDQRFRLGQALALDQITGKLITDPRILLVQQQAGMKFLFGGDIIAARGRGTGAIARRPARQPTIGLLGPFICLPVEICRIGIAPLPLIDIGQQFERRAALRIAGTDQRLGIGLRVAKPALRQRRARIGQPAKEARRSERLRPLPGRTSLRRLVEQVTRFAKAPLAQAHQAKAAQRVGIIAIGRHGALERALRAIQIIGVERLETARARRATASIAAWARGLRPICRRGSCSRRGRRASRR